MRFLSNRTKTGYMAKVPVPGCYTQGKTVEQAMERIREAIQVCLEAEELEVLQAALWEDFDAAGPEI